MCLPIYYSVYRQRITHQLRRVKPATGRSYVPTFSLSGTVPAFTCDCLRFVCAFTRRRSSTCVCLSLREQCLRSKITSVARVAHVLLLRFVAGNMGVNTLASTRSELIGNTAIVRKRCVIHNKSTRVCLRLSVAAETPGRKVRPVAGFKTQQLS